MPTAIEDSTETVYLNFSSGEVCYTVEDEKQGYVFDYDRDGNLLGAELLFSDGEPLDIPLDQVQAAGRLCSRGKYNSTMGGPPQGEPPTLTRSFGNRRS